VNTQTITIVIKHPVSVTKEFLLGVDPGFPPGDRYLCPPVIRRAQAALMSRAVQRFEDGMYHGEIHNFGMQSLISDVSAHDAQSLIQRIETKPDADYRLMVFLGIRWEVSNRPRLVRIFGPRSDPDNQVVIDLTKEES
jgi:hypothetical protein